MPNLRSYSCPECGSFLEVDRNKDTFDCPFCGKHFDALDFHREELFEQANKYLEGRQYEIAKKKFEYLLSQDPDDLDFLYGYACAVGGIGSLKPAGFHQTYDVRLIELLTKDERYKKSVESEYFAKFAEICSICNENGKLTAKKAELVKNADEGIKKIESERHIGCGTCFGYLIVHIFAVYAIMIAYGDDFSEKVNPELWSLYVFGLPILMFVVILAFHAGINRSLDPKFEKRKAPFYEMQKNAKSTQLQIDELSEKYDQVCKELSALKPKEYRRKVPVSKAVPEKAKATDVKSDSGKQILCKKCGGVLVLDSAKKLYKCDYCGVAYDYEMFVGDRYTKAKTLLNNCEYENAYKWYSEILEDKPDDFVANSGRILAALNLRSFLEFRIDRKYDKVNWDKALALPAEATSNTPEKYGNYFSMLGSLMNMAKEYTEVLDGIKKAADDKALLERKSAIAFEFNVQYVPFIAEDKKLRAELTSKKTAGIAPANNKKKLNFKPIKKFTSVYDADEYYRIILFDKPYDAEAHRGRILSAGGWHSVDSIKLAESFHPSRQAVLEALTSNAEAHTHGNFHEYFVLVEQLIDLIVKYSDNRANLRKLKEKEEKTVKEKKLFAEEDRWLSDEWVEINLRIEDLNNEGEEIEQEFDAVQQDLIDLDLRLF